MARRRDILGSALLAVLAVLLTVGAEVSLVAVKATAAVLLCALLGFACWRTASRLELSTSHVRIGASCVAVLASLMVTGFLLSLTRVGIRPDSVAPCLLVMVLVLLALGRTDHRVHRPARPAISYWAVLLSASAVAVLAGALVLSLVSYRSWEARFHFTSLSASFAKNAGVVVRVTNHEGHSRSYRLVVHGASGAALQRTDRIDNGGTDELHATVPDVRAVRIELYLPGARQPLHELTLRRSTTTGA